MQVILRNFDNCLIIWSCSHERQRLTMRSIRYLDRSEIHPVFQQGCGLRWSVQCIIDMLWSRFRTWAIRQNDCNRIPRITVDCHRHCCDAMSIPRVKPTWDHPWLCNRINRRSRCLTSPRRAGTYHLHTVSKEPRKIARGEDMSLIAGSAYEPLPMNSNNPRDPLDLNIIRLSESSID